MSTTPVVDPEHIRSSFELPPEKAIEYLNKKGFETSWSWRDTASSAHHQAFTVAKVMQMDVLEDIRGMLEKAQRDGMPFDQFQKELRPMLEARGWWGKKTITAPDGTEQEAQLGSMSRLRTIYRVNIGAAAMAGRYLQSKKHAGRRPFWRYVATLDDRTRPKHRSLNDIVLFHDDPFWDTSYPPNDYLCRCTVQTLSARQIAREGISLEDILQAKIPADFEPHEAFRSNPAIAWEPDLSQYPKPLRDMYREALKPLPKPKRVRPKEIDRLDFGPVDDRDDLTKAHFNGQVTVDRSPTDAADIQRLEKDFFGRSLTDEEWIRLTGAPDGAEINVYYTAYGANGETIYAKINHPIFYADRNYNDSKRSIYRNFDGRVELHNDILMLEDGRAPKGLGTRIFATQVIQARKLKIRQITVYAAGDKRDPEWKGYIVWPKLGYDAPLPMWVMNRLQSSSTLPAKAKNATTLRELFRTEAGVDWWEDYGKGMNMSFDLRKRSVSSNYLRLKLKLNGVRL